MPRIHDYIQDCVTYLYPTESHAEEGDKIGGSGFLLGVRYPPSHVNDMVTFAVSNAHVVKHAPVVRLNAKDGTFAIVPFKKTDWIPHPDGDDLAIVPFPLDIEMHKFSVIPDELILTHEIITKQDIGIGDEVYVVGRFINHEGKQKNSPSLRFGNIAQMPGEKLMLDTGMEQEVFLIEAKSIGGYSGAPVFVHLLPFSARPQKDDPKAQPLVVPFPGIGPWLLGVDCCHIQTWDSVRDKDGKPIAQGWQVPTNTGMMGVVPAWKIKDIFDSERGKEIFKKCDEELARRNRLTQAATDSVVSQKEKQKENPPNPNHKEDFNRLLDNAVKEKK
jgi:hypothetical protein